LGGGERAPPQQPPSSAPLADMASPWPQQVMDVMAVSGCPLSQPHHQHHLAAPLLEPQLPQAPLLEPPFAEQPPPPLMSSTPPVQAPQPPQTPVASQSTTMQPPVWYRVAFCGGISARVGPDVDAPRTGAILPCNEVFPVCEAVVGQDQRIYLRLADGRGWVFDDSLLVPEDPSVVRGHWEPVSAAAAPAPTTPSQVPSPAGNSSGPCGPPPGVLTVPARVSHALPAQHNMAAPSLATSPPEPAWFQVTLDDGMAVHSAPDLGSPLTGATLHFHELVAASESVVGVDGRTWLRLTDGRGWIFDDAMLYPERPAVVHVEPPAACMQQFPNQGFMAHALVPETRRWMRGKRGGAKKRRPQNQ